MTSTGSSGAGGSPGGIPAGGIIGGGSTGGGVGLTGGGGGVAGAVGVDIVGFMMGDSLVVCIFCYEGKSNAKGHAMTLMQPSYAIILPPYVATSLVASPDPQGVGLGTRTPTQYSITTPFSSSGLCPVIKNKIY